MFPFNKYIFDNQDTQIDLSSQENFERITNLPPPAIIGTQIKN